MPPPALEERHPVVGARRARRGGRRPRATVPARCARRPAGRRSRRGAPRCASSARDDTVTRVTTLCLGEALVDLVCEHPVDGIAARRLLRPALRRGDRERRGDGGASRRDGRAGRRRGGRRVGRVAARPARARGRRAALVHAPGRRADAGGLRHRRRDAEPHFQIYGAGPVVGGRVARGPHRRRGRRLRRALLRLQHARRRAGARGHAGGPRAGARRAASRSCSTRTSARAGWPTASRAAEESLACVPGAFLVKCNRAEARLMTGEADAEAAAASLLAQGRAARRRHARRRRGAAARRRHAPRRPRRPRDAGQHHRRRRHVRRRPARPPGRRRLLRVGDGRRRCATPSPSRRRRRSGGARWCEHRPDAPAARGACARSASGSPRSTASRAPPHGHPIAELVLTVLSQSTNDRNRDVAYLRLRERFPTWEAVRDAPVEEVEEAIRPGGISKVKSQRIQEILRAIDERHGSLDLDWMADAPVQEAQRLPRGAAGRRPQDRGVRPAVQLRAARRPGRHARLAGRHAPRPAPGRRELRRPARRDARDHAARRRARVPREPPAPRPPHLPCPHARAARTCALRRMCPSRRV